MGESDGSTWAVITRLRLENRHLYQAIEELVGLGVGDPTVGLMKRFYAEYPVIARAVHRDILKRDLLIYDHSLELAYDDRLHRSG